MITGETITDEQIRRAYHDGVISYDLMEFSVFGAWKATQRYYRTRCAEIINARVKDKQ